MQRFALLFLIALLSGCTPQRAAGPKLLGIATLTGATDQSGLKGKLENQVDAGNMLGGTGSSLTYAGHDRFLALPDRGPNARVWSEELDQTTSFVSRFHEITLIAEPSKTGAPWPMAIKASLKETRLLYSDTPLNYGAVTPEINETGKNGSGGRYYFTGRSDNFGTGGSLNFANGRLDPEGLCLSRDKKSVFISDEYGPSVSQFNRQTGQRERSFSLPKAFEASFLSPTGDKEIKGNLTGRVANKGLEGLTCTPDGQSLVGFEQSALLQDGGESGRANRIVRIDLATGRVEQFVYDNQIPNPTNPSAKKTYNSSEILAINNHEFLILERDGKGQGDGSPALIKQLLKVDLSGATDIGPLNLSGEAKLLPYAVPKSLFLDLRQLFSDHGFKDTEIPAKLEGAAFGDDVTVDGTRYHSLWISNDNDFLPATAGENRFFLIGFTDQDLGVDNTGRPTLLER